MIASPCPTRLRAVTPAEARDPGAPPRARWWREVALVGLFYLLYEVSRAVAPSHRVEALAHGRSIGSLEAALHLDPERFLDRVLAHHDLLGATASYYYGTLHFLVTPAVLVWLYLTRPRLYPLARTVLIVASLAALLVFWLYPVAPPRLALGGLTDIVVDHNVFGTATAFGTSHAAASGGFVNIYAAIPSLHAGWAFWVACAVEAARPATRWRHAVWLYPLATSLVVMGTANHYLVDVVAGAGIFAAAGVAVRLVRPSLVMAARPLPDLREPSPELLTGALR